MKKGNKEEVNHFRVSFGCNISSCHKIPQSMIYTDEACKAGGATISRTCIAPRYLFKLFQSKCCTHFILLTFCSLAKCVNNSVKKVTQLVYSCWRRIPCFETTRDFRRQFFQMYHRARFVLSKLSPGYMDTFSSKNATISLRFHLLFTRKL